MKRSKLIKELENYKYVPGHGPDYSKMTDKELEKQLEMHHRITQMAIRISSSRKNKSYAAGKQEVTKN